MKKPKKPHILILMTDQQRADHTPMEEHPYVESPTIAEIAKNGTYFRNAYVPSPVCVPGRQSILSGQYPRHCGCRRFGEDIAPDVVTYPQWFGNHGYYTASAGKMHFMGQDQMHGWQRRIGFDQATPASAYAGFDGEAARDLADPIDGTGKWIWDDEVRNARYGKGYWARHDRYAIDGALIFLDQFFAGPDYDRIGQRPLLLQVSLLMPHYPYICREDWFNYYLNRVEPYFDAPTEIHPCQRQRLLEVGRDATERQVQRATAAYCGMISEADEQFRRVIDRLKYLGVYDDFIIVFHSDHGEMLGELGCWEKFVFFDGSARAPLLISAPGQGWERKTINQNVNHLDLYPTLCDLVGLPRPMELDGSSLAPLIHGESEEDPQAVTYSELYDYSKLDERRFHSWSPGTQLMIRKGKWKYATYEMEDWPDQLFDLETDPGENRNLASDKDQGKRVKAFTQLAGDFWKEERRLSFPVRSGRWSYGS